MATSSPDQPNASDRSEYARSSGRAFHEQLVGSMSGAWLLGIYHVRVVAMLIKNLQDAYTLGQKKQHET